jgi:DNA invertase Pin-like site-specific DNA recombinase
MKSNLFGAMEGKFVSYIRKSPSNHLTEEEGLDSNSIGAQRSAISHYLDGGNWILLKEFVEYESANRRKAKQRPELVKALRLCKAENATLIIARLDRLIRSVSFLCELRDSGVEFRALDCLNMDKFSLTIVAAVAERELETLSARTKAGMKIAKLKGAKIGNPDTTEAIKRSTKARRAQAQAFADDLKPVIEDIKLAFKDATLQEIADCLNRRGYKTIQDGLWHPTSVARLLKLLQDR